MVRWSVLVLTGTTPITGFWLNLAGIGVFLGFGALPVLFGMQRFKRADLSEEKSGPGWADRLSISHRFATETSSGSLSRLPFASASDRSRIGPILRGDLNHTLKSWIVQGAILLFVLLVAPGVWQDLRPGPGVMAASQGVSPADQIAGLTYSFTLPVLILGTAVGYQAIVGERESGTVRLVLGLPGTRRDLVVGKLLTRVAIVIAAIVPMLVFAEGVLLWRFGDPYLVVFLASAGWILLLGIVWTMFVVGVSAAVSSRYRTLAVTLGAYLLFSLENGIWDPIVRPLIGLAFTGRFSTPDDLRVVDQLGPLWFRYIDRLSPLVALGTIEQTLEKATGVTRWYVTVPLVLFSIVITVSFAVGSLYIGYRRFARTDLG
jgi:ABC-type transport system involved in multi-copper enzyme maturation permease subunit